MAAHPPVVYQVPFTDPTPCKLCIGLQFTRAGGKAGLMAHHKGKHAGRQLSWQCSSCAILKPSYPGATIHFGKCTGPRPEARLPFPCEVGSCTRSFSSKRGRSQHVRNQHPNCTQFLAAAVAAPQTPHDPTWTPAPLTLRAAGMHQSEWKDALLSSLAAMEDANIEGPLTDVGEQLRSVGRRLRIGVPIPETEINEINDLLVRIMLCNRPDGDLRRTRRKPGKKMRNSRRTRRFARVQNLLSDNPRELARIIETGDLASLDQHDARRPHFSKEEIATLYGPLWETVPPCRWPVPASGLRIPPEQVWTPLSPDEVWRRIGRISRSSAGGLDGIRKSDILGLPAISNILARYYTVLLITGYYPRNWKLNRTTLIPKAGRDPSLIGNCRPITVGSMLARIYSGLLCDRIVDSVVLSQRQKGFLRVNGTFENCFLLDEALRASKTDRKDLVALVVDIKRAFDTVPREALRGSLQSVGLPDIVISRVMASYEGATTLFKSKDGEIEIGLERGVKQGDPCSPIFFDIVLDPLIRYLDTLLGPGHGPLAYADDLVVLCGSPAEGQQCLSAIDTFLRSIGMGLSVDKCSVFHVKRLPSGTMCMADPGLVLDNVPITPLRPEDKFWYLGVEFNGLRGLDNRLILEKLTKSADRVASLPLKPRQKIRLFYKFILPRSFYRMAIDPPSQTKLKAMDRSMRVWVKAVLHLPPSTPKGLIHCQTKDGGLGLPTLTNQIWLSHLRATRSVLDSDDALLQHYCVKNNVLARIRRAAETMRIAWPQDGPDLALAKSVLRQGIVDEWTALPATGHGVGSFLRDPIGNRWLHDPTILKESNFLIAIRLRANLFGVRQALRRVDPSIPPGCRHCSHGVESLMHVLNVCPHSHAKVVKRHDDIRDFVSGRLTDLGKTVYVEQTFTDDRGNKLRPDIVTVTKDTVTVIDIAVTYETDNSLRDVAKGKVDKYSRLRGRLLERFACRRFRVLPVVVGSRGALPVSTKTSLRELGLNTGTDGLTVAMIALRCSVAMAARHMDNG